MALPQFHPARQIEGLLAPTKSKGSLKGGRPTHGHESRRHPAGKSVPTRIGLHIPLQLLIRETVLLGSSNESRPTSGAPHRPHSQIEGGITPTETSQGTQTTHSVRLQLRISPDEPRTATRPSIT